ncbi:MAG: hypothetical protein B7733_26115 [Myxococcales bacterium FL481]|nr:MAG: hypothetical protein B7733_26115 [Myxococcales bacterium FL481]
MTPRMWDHFRDYDSDAYAVFTCLDCHGANAASVDYQMPNGLTALDPDDPIGSSEAIDPEMTQFMIDVVTPKMRRYLNNDEFGCFGCHEQQ